MKTKDLIAALDVQRARVTLLTTQLSAARLEVSKLNIENSALKLQLAQARSHNQTLRQHISELGSLVAELTKLPYRTHEKEMPPVQSTPVSPS